ncbi:unnamed protein product [Microthlaspi erraticum]|uniref:hAT-like transposase RNase-H fold domain-containing protein n=1 Tax=Microthlaspi erraticum TaxID=1685480 RepID=A0A6D2IFI0_9BRAS|nr:unnamed protein product [Microthlaspi erraticum]
MVFEKHRGSVCLTTDTWTSIQNINYMCLTAHYVDESWNLKKKIINFCQIFSHKGELIGKMVERCLLSWGITNVFTITVDNASANDVGIRFLKRRLRTWGISLLDGEHLHMRCGAHILNLVVRDGLDENKATISRIRAAV